MKVSLVFEGTVEEITQLTRQLKSDPDLEPLVKELEGWVPEVLVRAEITPPEGYASKEDLVSFGVSLGERKDFLHRIWNAFGRAAPSLDIREFFHPDLGWSYKVEDLKALEAYRLEFIPNFGKRSIDVFIRSVEALSERGSR